MCVRVVQEEGREMVLTPSMTNLIRVRVQIATDEAEHLGKIFTPIFWRRIDGRLTYIARVDGQKRSLNGEVK